MLHDHFDYYARARGSLCVAEQAGRSITYAEGRRRANQMANAMFAAGLHPGDRLAFVGGNSVDHALVYFAASKAGVILVPINPRLTEREIGFIVQDAAARAVIADSEHAPRAPALDTRVAIGHGAPAGWIDVDDWVRGQPDSDPPHRAAPDDVLYQMYTSGTTGLPKGVLLSHRSVLTNCAQVSAGLSYRVEPGDRWLIVAPLFHAAAVITAFSCVAGGGCLVLHRGFEPTAVVAALAEDRIALTTLVPAMIQACLAAVPEAASRRYPALRAIAYGGSAIDQTTLRQAMATFDCDFYQGFGQTESSAGLTYLTELDHRAALAGRTELLASCGRALPGTELRIVDPQGDDLPPGAVGEVVARGPQLMLGYWNRPRETAAALRDGWLFTGDAGRLDGDGYLTICDRLRDMIVTGAENVYPREVEGVLLAHPAVADAAVIGVPDERWGEAVHGFIVLCGGATATPDELREHCRAQLAGFKIPRSFEFVDELPRNASGKVRKRELRRPHWDGHDRSIA